MSNWQLQATPPQPRLSQSSPQTKIRGGRGEVGEEIPLSDEPKERHAGSLPEASYLISTAGRKAITVLGQIQ
jgi:hypothetical protein